MPVLVIAVTCLAFLPALRGVFVWDDIENLVDNERFRGLGGTQLRWMWRTTLLGHYIPLTWMSLGLNYVLGGMDPWGYHVGNLALHIANAGLLYFVARRLLAAAFAGGVDTPGGRNQPRWLALSVGAAFAALAFGVHPLRVESVAWVTERRDVLCGFFYLWALLAYLHGVAQGGRIDRRWWGVSVGAFLLALLSKASAMPLPAALLLLDVYPLRRAPSVGWRTLLAEKVPYALLAAAAGAMAVFAQSQARALTGYTQYGVGARFGMTAFNLMFYPSKFVWAADLSPLYELPRRVDPLAWRFLLPGAAFVVITAALVLLRRRCPGALAAWIYSALLVLPVTGAVAHAGVQLASDRYSYLSGLGFAVLAGGGLVWLLGARVKASVLTAAVVMLALVIAGWVAASWRQSKVWRDSEMVWRQALEVDPDCAVCSINLGSELTGRLSPDPRGVEEAERLFRRTLRINPSRVYAYHGLGVALAMQHRYQEAEEAFREYMRHEPADPTGPADLGLLRLAEGRYAEAIPELRRALAMSPGFPGLGMDLAKALRGRGAELRREGRALQGEAFIAEAEELDRREARNVGRPAQRSGTITPR